MIELTHETVQKMAELARLNLDDDEIERARAGLVKILAAFEALSHLQEPPGGAPAASPWCDPMVQSVPFGQHHPSALREDIAENSLSAESLVAQAPAHEGRLIRVPPVPAVVARGG